MILRQFFESIDPDGEVHPVPLYQHRKQVPAGLRDRHGWSLLGHRIRQKAVPRAALVLPTLPYEGQRLQHFFAPDQTEPHPHPFTGDLHRFLGWFSLYRHDFIRHPDDHSAKSKHANRKWGWNDVKAHVLGQAPARRVPAAPPSPAPG